MTSCSSRRRSMRRSGTEVAISSAGIWVRLMALIFFWRHQQHDCHDPEQEAGGGLQGWKPAAGGPGIAGTGDCRHGNDRVHTAERAIERLAAPVLNAVHQAHEPERDRDLHWLFSSTFAALDRNAF